MATGASNLQKNKTKQKKSNEFYTVVKSRRCFNYSSFDRSPKCNKKKKCINNTTILGSLTLLLLLVIIPVSQTPQINMSVI